MDKTNDIPDLGEGDYEVKLSKDAEGLHEITELVFRKKESTRLKFGFGKDDQDASSS